jgi:hypothetical protein
VTSPEVGEEGFGADLVPRFEQNQRLLELMD